MESDPVERDRFENPYAPSQGLELESPVRESNESTSQTVVRAILVWTLVCTLSAAPSFLIAGSNMAKNQQIAMVLGIVIFIAIYSAADLLSRNSLFRKNRRMRNILRTTFIVRSVSVIVFPIALTTDMVCGFLAVSFVGAIYRMTNFEFKEHLLSFGQTLATTLVQGVILSILLFFIGLLISVILFLFRALSSQLQARNQRFDI